MADEKSFSELLDELRPKIHWKVSLHDESKQIYRQVQKTYFEPLSLNACKMDIRTFYQSASPTTVGNLVMALTEDKNRLFDDTLFSESRKHALGFLNGVFDLRTGKLRPYQSSDFVCDPLPHNLPERLSKPVEKWLLNILMQWVGEETAGWFLNAMAYMIFAYPNTEQVWMNFFGSGANGKSLCLEILERTVGDKKCIGCDLKHINRFTGDTVQDKWLVIGRDSSSEVSEGAVSFIKTFSGDPKVLVEKKGGASFDTMNQGKLIVSTNSLIQSKDRSYAWYRRLLPVPFPNVFDRNDKFKQELFQRLPEIIRVFAHRAYLYHQNETSLWSSIPKPVKDLLKETRMMNDRVASFWEGYFYKNVGTEDVTSWILDWKKIHQCDGWTMTQMYDCYTRWHQQEFGDMPVVPSMKTFCGHYGEWLSGEAGRYFLYKRTESGRILTLKPEYANTW